MCIAGYFLNFSFNNVAATIWNLFKLCSVFPRRTTDVMGYVSGVDVLLGVLPWYHIYGQTIVALAGLKAGTSIVSLPKFSPELFLSVIKKYKVNINLRVFFYKR